MDKEDISRTLEGLGLRSEEAMVYLAALELGSQPASIIAKKAGLKRGQTYNVIEALIQKGIVQEFTKNKVRYFASRPPNTLVSLIEHQEDEIKEKKRKLLEAVPLLNQILNPMIIQPKVRFFQGVEGLKDIYEDTLRKPTHAIYAIGDFEHMFPEHRDPKSYDWLWKYCNRRGKQGIWFHGIMNKSAKSDRAYRQRKEEKRKMKMLENVYLPVEMNIYGNKVALMSTAKDMVGLIIEDAHIAENMRNLHKAIWTYLPDYRLQ